MSLSLIFKWITPQITQKFWNKLFVNWKDFYKQFGLNWHNWVDFRVPIWTPLYAPKDWMLTTTDQWKAWYWKYVVIKWKVYWDQAVLSKVTWVTEVLFWHLSKFNLLSNTLVKAWDLIWWSWNSWGSTWPHLHFWLRFHDVNTITNTNNWWNVLNYNNWFQWWVDPLPYFLNWKYFQ